MSKYSSLPDVDTQSPDVFESTGATEVRDYTPTATTKRRPSISSDSIPRNEATKVFESKSVDATGVDYSDTVSLRKSFRVSTIPETLDARIIRLQREVEEVRTQARNEQHNTLDNLQEVLDKLESSGQGGDLGFYNGMGESNGGGSREQVKHTQIQKAVEQMVQLESRIDKLEKTVGVRGGDNGTTLQQSIRDMTQRVSLVVNNPVEAEKAIGKLTQLANFADKIRNSKEPTPREDDLFLQRRIRALYEKLGQVEQMGVALPHVISRLKSLNTVHADATAAVNSVQSADATIDTIKHEMDNWVKTIKRMESRVQEGDKKMEANKQEVSEWIKNVEQKIDNL